MERVERGTGKPGHTEGSQETEALEVTPALDFILRPLVPSTAKALNMLACFPRRPRIFPVRFLGPIPQPPLQIFLGSSGL